MGTEGETETAKPAPEPIPELVGLAPDDIARALGGPDAHLRAKQILAWIYTKRVFDFAAMSDLPAALRERLPRVFRLALPECVRVQGSGDETRKFLFRLADGQLVETVLIPASPALYGEKSDRLTLCVSSQVGCAYGCKFCASGLDGWKRNLTPAEIVGQILAAEAKAGERVSNLVFMGMGEPFANFENLLSAIRALNAPWGCGIGARRITVSTSGLAPRIAEYADQPLQLRLAISLHGATDEVRGKIMPINARYPLAELLAACSHFSRKKKQHITFEFILIDGINCTREQASALARIAAPLRAKVNLIPYNSVPGLPWKRPPEDALEAFLATLRARGIQATLRREKGHDIAAACGQLRLHHETAQGGGAPPKGISANSRT